MVPAEGQVGTMGEVSPAPLQFPTPLHASMGEWGQAGAEGLTFPLTAR